MRTTLLIAVAAAVLSASLVAQELKPVPKDSMRVTVPGCTKGQIFTAGPRSEDQPGRGDIPEGMHFRMNGPKTMMTEVKAHEGSMIEISGLIKRGQRGPDGVGIGGIRIAPGTSSPNGSVAGNPNVSQNMIDVEGWRTILGSCPS
jgi:hypothetical protein